MRLLTVLFSLVALPAIAEPMTFELRGNGGNCNGCEWIQASGEITSDTPDALRAFMDDGETFYLYAPVTFDSPGGNLGAAIELGRMLRQAGASTSVGRSQPMRDMPQYFEFLPGGRCESACTFALLGGAARWVDEGQLGIHRFYTPDNTNIPTAATQQIMGQIVLYLIELGISPELLTLASRIPGSEMHYLTTEEMARLGIVTDTRDTPQRLEIADGGLVLRWEAMKDDGDVDRHQQIRCSQGHSAWMLSVVDTDIGPNNGVIGPDNADGLHVTIGDQGFPMTWNNVVDLSPAGQDYRMEVTLPVDLRDFAGQKLQFQTNDARNFWMVLSADLQLPDATTLDALVRACGI